MAAGPGQYALLIGSGVSRSAGIPTGWEITLDLVSQIARAQNGDAPADPQSWWNEQRSDALEYSKLLEELAPRPAERAQLLRSYFEPTDEEQEADMKVPASAHHAIAKLVTVGVVRVIITTNFDRLLERAIEDAGKSAVVISTADQAEGASPLVHNACTIVKVNGDYHDTRIKNSEAELASYDPRINALLDRIFDEYGLVVCGWSADWDSGLRAAIERAKNRRYTTYWATRGALGTVAAALVAHRGAVQIPIADADQFFGHLASGVAASRESEGDPDSVEAAVAQLKQHLARSEDRIRYADLMRRATEDLVRATGDDQFPLSTPQITHEDCVDRMRRYTDLTERLLHLVATAAYWGEDTHVPEIVALLRRLAEVPEDRQKQRVWVDLARYPALLAMYAASIGMVARKNYSRLHDILSCEVRSDIEPRPLLVSLVHHQVVSFDLNKALHGTEPKKTPLSGELYEILRDVFRDLIPSENEYQDVFDRFEYLQTLAQLDWQTNSKRGSGFSGGCFEWRRHSFSPEWLPNVFDRELERDGPAWAPLQAGMFGGEMDRVKRAKTDVDEWARRRNF